MSGGIGRVWLRYEEIKRLFDFGIFFLSEYGRWCVWILFTIVACVGVWFRWWSWFWWWWVFWVLKVLALVRWWLYSCLYWCFFWVFRLHCLVCSLCFTGLGSTWVEIRFNKFWCWKKDIRQIHTYTFKILHRYIFWKKKWRIKKWDYVVKIQWRCIHSV